LYQVVGSLIYLVVW